MAILFITHDLGVVANMADEVVVLYHGRVMESGSCAELLSAPRHPYLKALLHAVPRLRMTPGERLTPIREVPASGRALLTNGHADLAPGAERGAPRPCCSRSRTCARPSGRARAAGSGARPGRSWRSTTSDFADRARASPSGWSARAAAARPPCPRSSCGRSGRTPAPSPSMPPDGPIDVLALEGQSLERFRRRLQYIFQDPFHSLNPAHDRVRHRGRAAGDPRHRRREGADRCGSRRCSPRSDSTSAISAATRTASPAASASGSASPARSRSAPRC